MIPKNESILNNDKIVLKPSINFNNGSLSIKERLQIFNSKNNNNSSNNSSIPIKSEPNIKKEEPKKLAIDPNLLGKDGKIKIMASKDKVNIKYSKREIINNKKKDNTKNENKLQDYLYDNKEEKSDKNKVKEIPKPREKVIPKEKAILKQKEMLIPKPKAKVTFKKREIETPTPREKEKEILEKKETPKRENENHKEKETRKYVKRKIETPKEINKEIYIKKKNRNS